LDIFLIFNIHSTDPNDSDSDNDGMPDGWEVSNSLDPLMDDAAGDSDLDLLSNIDEYNNGTDPNDSDTDNDLMPDGWEVINSLDPLVDDAIGDPDLDNLSNLDEYNIGTNPHNADTDGDGYSDGEENHYYWKCGCSCFNRCNNCSKEKGWALIF